MPNAKPPKKKLNRVKPLAPQLKTYRMPDELLQRIAVASEATGLKSAEIVRLSIDRGIDSLIYQLKVGGRRVMSAELLTAELVSIRNLLANSLPAAKDLAPPVPDSLIRRLTHQGNPEEELLKDHEANPESFREPLPFTTAKL